MKKKKKGYISIDRELCKACRLCITSCPRKLIVSDGELNLKGFYPARFVDEDERCTGCAQCAVVCPEVAIEVYRG